jgi:uncharacterized protein (UPF0548 family)
MARLIEELKAATLTYNDIGATLTGQFPGNFRVDRYAAELGRGPETFQRAVAGLQDWKAHCLLGLHIFPAQAKIESGATVVVTFGTPLVALAAPCRIVAVVNEVNRWGFAYGTLPGHPEQGEEAFVVSISPAEEVTFNVTAFSRPGDPLVRLSGPIGRSAQRYGTKSYLRALRRFVRSGR